MSKVVKKPVVKTTTKFELELTKEDILELLSIPSIQKNFGIEEGPLPKNVEISICGDQNEYDGYPATDGYISIEWEK
jgi:hypothetical protein